MLNLEQQYQNCILMQVTAYAGMVCLSCRDTIEFFYGKEINPPIYPAQLAREFSRQDSMHCFPCCKE